MKVFRSIRALQHKTKSHHNKHVVVVPTMGNLHEGHLSLIKKARSIAGKNGLVIVTIFINKTQFSPEEDLNKYPRTIKDDLHHCQQLDVDIVFTPKDKDMYKTKHSSFVVEEILSKRMEGKSRPTHFRGVTTVVAKLFNIIQPNVAIFGAKDWQQAIIIKHMANDLNFPVRVVITPTIREKDGLAISSRNNYLNDTASRNNFQYFTDFGSSRQTELCAVQQPHLVCKWIGNTEVIAINHFLQETGQELLLATHSMPIPWLDDPLLLSNSRH